MMNTSVDIMCTVSAGMEEFGCKEIKDAFGHDKNVTVCMLFVF